MLGILFSWLVPLLPTLHKHWRGRDRWPFRSSFDVTFGCLGGGRVVAASLCRRRTGCLGNTHLTVGKQKENSRNAGCPGPCSVQTAVAWDLHKCLTWEQAREHRAQALIDALQSLIFLQEWMNRNGGDRGAACHYFWGWEKKPISPCNLG